MIVFPFYFNFQSLFKVSCWTFTFLRNSIENWVLFVWVSADNWYTLILSYFLRFVWVLVSFIKIQILRILKRVFQLILILKLSFLSCIQVTFGLILIPLWQILFWVLKSDLLLNRLNWEDAGIVCWLIILELLIECLLLLNKLLLVWNNLHWPTVIWRWFLRFVQNIANFVPNVSVVNLSHLRILKLLGEGIFKQVLQVAVNFPLRLDRHTGT